MVRRDAVAEATLKELETDYEKALRYALRYDSRWDRLEEAGKRLRTFIRQQQDAEARAA